MAEDYLKKVITFEDGKLLCDGEEISIEEAERIVQLQVKAMEENAYQQIQDNPDLEREDIDRLADTVNETRINVAFNSVDVRGLEDYYETAKFIMDAHKVADRALSFFSLKNRKVKRVLEEPKKRIDVKWPGNIHNSPDYDPSIQEMSDVMTNMLFRELIFAQINKQFYNSELKIEYEDINALGSFATGFDVFIKNDVVDIYFRVDENEDKFENINGNFVASALRLGDFALQNTIAQTTKKSNNLRVAQTLENVIIKEIRFLKNVIKQEINFSLEQSTSRVRDRLNIANFFITNFSLFMDTKTKKRLEKIIRDSKRLMEENTKNSISESSNDNTDILINDEKEVNTDISEISSFIKEKISENFSIEIDKVNMNVKNDKDFKSYEIFLSGQRILITVKDNEVSVISNNTIGTGKTDFQKNNIYGKNIIQKLENACFMATIPLINRQIENIFNSIKIKDKKLIKDSDLVSKNIINTLIENIDIKEKLEKIRLYVIELIDKFMLIGDKISEAIFEIIDNIFVKINMQTFEYINSDVINKEQIENSYSVSNGIYFKYNKMSNDNETFIDKLDEIKKVVNRFVYRNLLIIEIERYKEILSESTDNFEEKILTLSEQENKITTISDYLSEDIIMGGMARRLLSLMDSSMSAKNDIFKFNLDEIVIEMIKTNL